MTTSLLGITIILYLCGLVGLTIVAHRQVQQDADFFVAGRRLPLVLACATLLATWLGVGPLLIIADEVAVNGLRVAALEPIGPGLCLIVVGLFFAKPLWQMQLVTMADFYRDRFGSWAERIFSLTVISHIGWIAAQLVAMASVLTFLFPISRFWCLVLVAVVAMGYTVLGGMWSVVLTDTLQVGLLLIGLLMVGVDIFAYLGDGNILTGLSVLQVSTSAEHLIWIPQESVHEVLGWCGILAIGILGNLPSSDLMQRVFSSQSAMVAQSACVVAGIVYIVFGMIPLALGLAAPLILPDFEWVSVVPALAQQVLPSGAFLVFILALVSAVLSTLDSAILAASSIITLNILKPMYSGSFNTLGITRLCIGGVTVTSLGIALVGENAYSLLEDSFALDLAASFVPLTFGLFRRVAREGAALAAMGLGLCLWTGDVMSDVWDVTTVIPWPGPLGILGLSLGTYLLIDGILAFQERMSESLD